MRGLTLGIGAGALIAGLVGFWNDDAANSLLITIGLVLITYGTYEAFIKPRFRVGHRLAGWFERRGWTVEEESTPRTDFTLRISSPSSKNEVVVTRDNHAPDDMIKFAGHILPFPDRWLDTLPKFSAVETAHLEAEIKAFLSAKNMSFSLLKDDEVPAWMPVVAITTAVAQDHTLSQQSVDVTAHSVELSIIGVRAVIEKAVLRHIGSLGASSGTESTV